MDQLPRVLKDFYGLEHTEVIPQQGGWAALAYRVQIDKQTYFLKVYEKSRASTPKWTALINDYVPVLLWLEDHSALRGKIPVPILTQDGCYQCEDDKGIYLLYEYIVGDTIADHELTKDQVRQLAEIVAELHRYGEEIPMVTSAMKESFDVPFLGSLRSILDVDMPFDIREVMFHHTDRLKELMDEVESLSEELKGRNLRMTLCHTDIHGWNLMSAGRQLKLIDWEGMKLAPVEADMMFFAEKPYFSEFMKIYTDTHHYYEVNFEALKFYQGRRRLEDVWEFTEQLLYDVLNDEERRSTLSSLRQELEQIALTQ
ncbi:aminoglycoside phosphotransferase family protein [Paenibacillus solani]|uniref:aminoglycoside phosphotransferase family protein n=1 Tax=Paenibacillus solani TaxID=1705565 RepID=UPI003D2B3944